MRRKSITAGDLLDKLEKDPQYQARQKEQERQREQNVQEYHKVAAPVLRELVEAGFSISYIGELRHKRMNYKDAIPILMRWLPPIGDKHVKEDIVRTLTVKWAKPQAASLLIKEYKRATNHSLKWTIGNALETVADDSVFDEIVSLVQDKKHGSAREMLAMALGKMKNPKAVDIAIDLLNDDEVVGHAIIALRKLKPKKAKPYIEPFLNHPKAWIRQEARKALKKIN